MNFCLRFQVRWNGGWGGGMFLLTVGFTAVCLLDRYSTKFFLLSNQPHLRAFGLLGMMLYLWLGQIQVT